MVAPWAARVVDRPRGFFLQELGKEILVRIPRRESRLEPGLRIETLRIVLQLVPLEDLVILVVPSPYHHRRMRARAPHILADFTLDALEEAGINGIVAAGESKVVPY